MNKKKLIIVFGIIIILGTFLIGIGLYFNNLSKPENIFKIAIDKIDNKIEDYIKISDDLNIGDTIELKGNLDFDIDSEYYKNHIDNEENIKKYNLIKNLNSLDTNFLIQQDKNKKITNIELNQSIDKESILDTKFYAENSTKYYYLKDVDENYINVGGFNYFENINKSNTTKDNIDYLHNFIISSIQKNLKKEYFDSKETTESINKEDKKVYESTMKIDDKVATEIINNVISDLKKDKKASTIINNIDKDILKHKIKDQKVLEKNEYIEIHIYTTKTIYRPLKYKIVHVKNNDTNTYIYEGNDTKGKMYYLHNDIIKYQIDLDLRKDDLVSKIYNSSNKEIGEFKIEKNKHNTIISYNYDDSNEKVDFIYSSKYTKIKKNSSFNNNQSISFKYLVNKESIINGDIYLNVKANNNPKILVDTSNAILKSNLTDKQKDIIENKLDNIKNRLEK